MAAVQNPTFGALTPNEMDEVFPHPPLREVAFEVRFNPRLQVSAEVWRFQDQLRLEYPLAATEQALQPNGSVMNVSVFNHASGSRVIKVTQQNWVIAFSKYSSFEDFKEEVIQKCALFASTFGITELTRIGLRYVNEIWLPSGDRTSILRYVRPLNTFDRFPLETVDQFVNQLSIRLNGHLATVRAALLPGPERIYVLDIDCHTDQPTASSDFPKLIDQFHDSAQRIFLDSVTEDFKEVMRGRK